MKTLSDHLFTSILDERTVAAPVVAVTYKRCSAKELGLREAWFRDAILASPELVIGPCRAAEITDDDWYPWQHEFQTEVGNIDVLLISSLGRVAVVETKLASNPEGRRKVLAQTLDYVTHLYDALVSAAPQIPLDESGEPVVELEDVLEAVSEGNVLVIIASDDIDSRVAGLSRKLLSDRLVDQWDLALVDLALYRDVGGESEKLLVVPSMSGVIVAERRHVVRVVVEGDNPKARVEVQRFNVDEDAPTRQKWDETRYFESLGAREAPAAVKELARNLRDLANRYPDSVRLEWGTGKNGTMVVKRRGGGIIEVRASGKLRFRPTKCGPALGEAVGYAYLESLKRIVPNAMTMVYPLVREDEAAKVAPAVFELVRKTLEDAEHGEAMAQQSQ